MALVHDIVIAKSADRDNVLSSADHLEAFRCVADAGFSIDDVVTLLSIRRGINQNRKLQFSLRREVYSSYKEDDNDFKRHIALLSSNVRDEIADLTETEISTFVDGWPETDVPIQSALRTFVDACRDARDAALAIMVKTYDAANAFQAAIEQSPSDQRESLRKSFDSWDATTKQLAHEKYKFLTLLGQSDCLGIVREEIEHGQPHCATLAFLFAIRRTAEGVIRGGIDGIDYLDQMDSPTAKALSRFKVEFDDHDQARILRAFAITLMSELVGVVEDGYAFGLPTGPTTWALLETDSDGHPTGNSLGELHAYLDGDDEFWPKADS